MAINESSALKQLETGIIELGLTLDEAQKHQLIKYLKMLVKWNRVYSLTAITDPMEMVLYHLLDGLTVINYLGGVKRIVDVGSGMGVPGVIIAICCQDIQVCAIDCNSKKTAFLQQVAIELELKNLKVVCNKVENYQPDELYDAGISRAFTSASLFIKVCKHLIKDTALLMKSLSVQNEINAIKDYEHSLIELKLPGSTDKRYLLKIEL